MPPHLTDPPPKFQLCDEVSPVETMQPLSMLHVKMKVGAESWAHHVPWGHNCLIYVRRGELTVVPTVEGYYEGDEDREPQVLQAWMGFCGVEDGEGLARFCGSRRTHVAGQDKSIRWPRDILASACMSVSLCCRSDRGVAPEPTTGVACIPFYAVCPLSLVGLTLLSVT